MKKNKIFLVTSVLIAAALFAAILLNKKMEQTSATTDLAPAENLIREHSFSKGDASAKVTIVEFFDPECEACREIHPIVEKIFSEYPGKIRLVYRYTPFHANSMYAISVLEEARALGKFEEALKKLFENQPTWGSHHAPKPELIPSYMAELGLETSLFERETVIAKHKGKIAIDQQDGASLMVRQTPTFFVNGKRLYNIDYDFIKMAVTDALKE